MDSGSEKRPKNNNFQRTVHNDEQWKKKKRDEISLDIVTPGVGEETAAMRYIVTLFIHACVESQSLCEAVNKAHNFIWNFEFWDELNEFSKYSRQGLLKEANLTFWVV